MYCDEIDPSIQKHASDVKYVLPGYDVEKNKSNTDIHSHGTNIPNQESVPEHWNLDGD